MQLRDYGDDNYEKRIPEEEFFSRLSGKQKFRVFFDLYKGWLIAVVLIAAAIIYSVFWYNSNKDNSSLYIALTNANTAVDSGFLTDGYVPQNVKSDFIVSVNDDLIVPRSMDTETSQYQDANVQKYDSMLLDGTIDISVINERLMRDYADADVFENLKEIIDDDTLNDSSVELYYQTDDDGNKVPVGIYINAIPKLAAMYDGDTDRYVITVSKLYGNSQEAGRYIEYLINQSLSGR